MKIFEPLTESLKRTFYSDKEAKQDIYAKNSFSTSTPPQYQEESDTVLSDVSYSYAFGRPIDHILTNRNALIRQWRNATKFPEVDEAIEEIVNEALVFEENNESPIKLDLDAIDVTENLKDKIRKSFDKINNLLEFDLNGSDLFRQWYTDGVLNLEVVYNNVHLTEGIKKIIVLPPFDFFKIRYIDSGTYEYFFNPRMQDYYNRGYSPSLQTLHHEAEIRYKPEQITQVTSGMYSTDRMFSISYLHKCLKVLNQLSLIEDAIVISRVTRAPEKKVFYIDTGRLPRAKAEAYIQQLMMKHRNQMSYNFETGSVENRKKSISLLEDFWIPRCLSLDTNIMVFEEGYDINEWSESKDISHLITMTLRDIINGMTSGKVYYTVAISPEGTIEPKLIEWSGITRKNTEVIEIELENGNTVRCTPDHKFLVWDDEEKTGWHYVKAKDLTEEMDIVEYEEKNV